MSIKLKLTSCVVIGGNIVKPGELAEVNLAEAKDLLSRGKAEPATAEDEAQVKAASNPGPLSTASIAMPTPSPVSKPAKAAKADAAPALKDGDK